MKRPPPRLYCAAPFPESSTVSAAAAPAAAPADRASSLTPSFWLGQMDLRPISLFRIAFGLFIAYDLLDLLPIATTFFSDSGVMPRASLLTQMARANRFSLSDVLGPPELVYIYWALTFVACLFVIFGYRTRIAVVVLYLFLAGINERLPELFDGSDSVIRLTLFWLCFCPSGNRYSLDALRARLRGAPLAETGRALPMRIVQAQIAWVYFCSALHKTGGNTWHEGTALHYVLHLNHVFARPWAAMLADYPIPMAFGTYFTLVLEFGFLGLVFFPIPKLYRWTKALGLLLGVALHGGIALTVNVGLFSYLMPVTYLAFFEPAWTEWLIDRLRPLCRGGGKTQVLYDGACAVCVRGAEALRRLDRFGNLELLDLRKAELPAAAKALKRLDLESRIHAISPSGAVSVGFAAQLAILARTPAGLVPAFLLQIPGLAQAAGWLYEQVAAQRHAVAKAEGWPVEVPLSAPVRPPIFSVGIRNGVRDVVALSAVGLFVCAAWYASPQPGRRHLPLLGERAVQWASIWNIWDMFSPEPLRTDYHLRAPAEYDDGSTDDLFGGAADGPGEVRGFWFSRWWKYLENVTQGAKVIQEEWARWQCKVHNWNDGPSKHGGHQLYRFRLIRDNQIIPPIGQPWPPVQTAEIVNWRCYDKPQDKPEKPRPTPPPALASPAPMSPAAPPEPSRPLLVTPASEVRRP
jgi:predicted DCC family thiol-disulfide oxidoreductase YuxK